MGIKAYFQRFYQRNLANGEFRKHKGAYLAAALLGYAALHATCGCAPIEKQVRDHRAAVERGVTLDQVVQG